MYINNFDFINDYDVYILDKTRLVEEPSNELKAVQKRIFKLLNKNIDDLLPNYVMSRKGISWDKNGKKHKDSNYFYLLDISKFFPSIERKKVFFFFMNILKTSPEVADKLSDIVTIDLDKVKMNEEVTFWYQNINNQRKHQLPNKHLATGTSTSPLLSVLVNLEMFNELFELAKNNNILMSLYVDDLTFSSKNKIPRYIIKKINQIINKYKYVVSKEKTKELSKNENNILITGVVIKKNSNIVTIRNKHSKKLIDYLNNNSKINCPKVIGLLNTIKQVSKEDYDKFKITLGSRCEE